MGDDVEFCEVPGGEGRIDEILPRRNSFDRPSVANIDQMVIVCSQAIPKTDPYLVDRMTAIAALKGCDVLICINKCDLDPADALREYYENAGFRTVSVSAETGEGIEALRAQLVGRLSAVTGNSGVGKSSILNALDPSMSLKTGEVSQALGRGRHTTRHVELYELPCGAEIIDTPGFLSDDTAEYAKNADIAIIPVQPGTLGLKPMKRTIKVITEANPDLSFAIIINNFAGNQTVDRQFLELLEADDLPVLGTVPTAAAFKQGAALGKPVYEIAKNGKAAQAIENILNELEEVL